MRFVRFLIRLLSAFRLGARRRSDRLVLQVPIIQISHSNRQIRRKAEPSQIWNQAPRSDGINLAPQVRHVSNGSGEGDDVDSGLDGAPGTKEERHPDEVEAELDGVEGGSVLGGFEDVFWLEGGEAGGDGAVGGVAHEAVEEGPCRTEDLGWWAEGGLFEGLVGFLGVPRFSED